MFRTPTPDDLAPFALALLFSAQPLLSQPPREEPARYFYFKESRELVRDLARVAVFDESAGALDARLAVLGVDASAVHAWPIRGWALVDVPAERRTTDGVGAWIADLASSGAIAFASPMFVGLDGGPLFPTRDLVVGFEAGVDAASAEAAISAAAPGMRLDRDWTGMPGVYRWRSSFRSGVDVLAAANALALLPSVTFAAPDMVFTGHGGHIPNDAGFVNCWPLHNVGQLGGVADNDMDGPEAWEITAGSPSVKIVILDSGIQQDHPDIHQVPGTDSTSDNASGTFTGGPVNVFDNHGTAVAGCATAVMDNGIGAVGIAPGCVSVSARTFITLNFAGSWTSQGSWTVASLAYAESIGARITNNSNVYGFVDPSISLKYSQTHAPLAPFMGIAHFACAGNTGASTLAYPASLSSVNAVAATTNTGAVAAFSNSGVGMDFSAPGQDVFTTDRTGIVGFSLGDTVLASGTSFSSPYAAGVAALVLSVSPSLNAVQVEQILKGSCVDVGAPGYDLASGFGVVNAARALLLLQSGFAPATTTPIPGHVRSLAVGDFDGNGTLDAVAAADASAIVFVLRGDGSGGFAAAEPHPTALASTAVAVGDLDRDGALDIVSVGLGPDLSVLLGDGAGGFAAPATWPGGLAGYSALVLGDRNSDGFPDAVLASASTPDVSSLPADGTGGFGAPVLSGCGSTPSGLATGDLDKDGALDLAAATSLGVAVLEGDGSGGLGPVTTTPLPGGAASISLGDVDGDGPLDAAASLMGAIATLLGDGMGGFGAPAAANIGSSAGAIAVTDVTGDGRVDLLAIASDVGKIVVMPGDGAGGFGGPTVIGFTSEVGTASALAVADFDADGRSDVLVSGATSGPGVSVLRNTAPIPNGVLAYGGGTAGCAGREGITASVAPHVGAADFALLTTQAPPNAVGLGVLSDLQDLAGSDPLHLDVLLHVGIRGAATVILTDVPSDAFGVGVAPLPIPNVPSFAGASFFAQAIWFSPECSSSTFHLSSSKGLRITLLS